MTFVARLLIVLIVPTWSCGSLCNLSESDAEVGLQIHAERLVDDPDYFRRGDRLHRRDRCLDSKPVLGFVVFPVAPGVPFTSGFGCVA